MSDFISSITSWVRLEPRPRDANMASSLQARVQDPLWLLARQWQFGEFQGEDCGSPVHALLKGELSRLNGYTPAKPYVRPTQAYSPRSFPLETYVERETILGSVQTNTGIAAALGRQFFGCLGARLTQAYRSTFLQAYALGSAPADADEKSRRLQSLLAGRVLDGLSLYARLKPLNGQPVALPNEPPFDAIAANDRAGVLAAVAAWLRRCDSYLQSDANPAWVKEKQEYEFTVVATTPQEECLLHAPEHRGDRLDWYSFDVAAPQAEAQTQPALPIRATSRGVVSPLAIAADGSVQRLRLNARVLHGKTQDLQIDLIAPSRKSVTLYKGKAGAKRGALNLNLDSDSSQVLRALCREKSGGVWRLRIKNTGSTAGTLQAWSLQLDLAPCGQAQSAVSFEHAVIPTPVHYQGMPAPRWWEFEDARVSFGSVEAGTSDLAKLLLMEFTLTYGNDFFMIPLNMEVGSLCRLNKMKVTNTFGEITQIKPSAKLDGQDGAWRMFCLTPESAATPDVSNLFFLAPTLRPILEAPSLEEVRFLRDEMANLAWALERQVQSPAGLLLDRYELWQEKRRLAAAANSPTPPPSTAGLEYQLETEVPDYWLPLIPQQAPLLPDGRRSRAIVLKMGGSHAPMGTILQPKADWAVNEEEIPRAGTQITRGYQYCRWSDGSTHLWVGRTKTVGRGEGSSGLAFDQVRLKNSSAP